MKTTSLLLILICCIVSDSATARNLSGSRNGANIQSSYKTETGSCTMPSSQFDMEINNVRARLLTSGDTWWDGANYAQYEVPRGGGVTAIFDGAIWVSGLDQGNNLKIAALEYSNAGTDYWPGPLDATGQVTAATCTLWDRHFPVWATQINPLITAYQAAVAAGGNPNSITLPLTSISDSVKFWPGKGNPYLTALGYDMTGVLAPFYDADGDGMYDPVHGDFPTLRQGGAVSGTTAGCNQLPSGRTFGTNNSAFADEMVFWVTNDMGNTHQGTGGGTPIGIQVNELAFAFTGGANVENTTFYTYNVCNKSGAVLNKACMSQFTDPDLGCANNDRVGCDTSRNLAFVYNGVTQGGTNTPGYSYECDMGTSCTTGAVGYGCSLPMLGIKMLEGPMDTNTNQVIERMMTAFSSYSNAAAATGDPATAVQYRNYQTGYWKDATPVTFGGNGYQNSSQRTPYMFPGDPSMANQWSECNPQLGAVIYAGDRRMVQTSGPFTFLPCASQFMSIAVIFIQPVTSNCPSLSLIDTAADQAQRLFNSGFGSSVNTGIQTIASGQIGIYPNPVSSALYFETSGMRQVDMVSVYDITGRLVATQTGSVRSVDMSALPDGVYVVKATVAGRESVLKVAKR